MTEARDIFPKHVQPKMEMTQAAWLEKARDTARRLCEATGSANIDQVRAYCPPPDHVDPRIMGAVFKHKDFVHLGFTRSKRKACHGRPISTFRLK